MSSFRTHKAAPRPAHLTTKDDAFAKAIRESQSNVSTSFKMRKNVTHSVNFEGILLRSERKQITYAAKGNSGTSNPSFMVCSYTVRLMNVDKIAEKNLSTTLVSLPDNEGVRFAKSNTSKDQRSYLAYWNGMHHIVKKHNLPLDAAKAVAASRVGDHPIFNNETKTYDHEVSFHVDMTLPPFCKNAAFEFRNGTVITFEVTNGKTIESGTLVSIDAFYIDFYLPKPKAENSKPKFEGGPVPKNLTPAEEEEQADLYHSLYDPDSKKALRYTFHAGMVRTKTSVYNSLPLIYRIRSFFPIGEQHWSSPVPGRSVRDDVFAVTIDPDVPEELTLDPAVRQGSFIGKAVPSRVLYQTNDVSGPDEPMTFSIERKRNATEAKKDSAPKLISPFYPLNTTVTNYRVVSTAEFKRMSSAEDYVARPLPGTDDILLTQAFAITSDIWSDHCRLSGIANVQAWSDVNIATPLSATALMGLTYKPNPSPDTLEMRVMDIGWDMEGLLRQYATPCTPEFGKRMLGNTGRVPKVKLGVDALRKDGVDVEGEVINTHSANEAFKNLIINATEASELDLATYVDPANQFECAVLIVPVFSDLVKLREVSDDAFNERQAQIAKHLEEVRAADTPADGDKVLEDFAKRVLNVAVEKMGQHARDYRVMVWYFKRIEKLFTPEVLSVPYYKQRPTSLVITPDAEIKTEAKEPEAAKTPEVKKEEVAVVQSMEVVDDDASKLKVAEEAEKPASETNDAMEVDDEVASSEPKPTPKKKLVKVEKTAEPDDSMEVDDEHVPSEPKPAPKKMLAKSEKRKLKKMEDDEAGAVKERDNSNSDEDEEEVVPPPKKKAKKEDSESESEARDIKKPKVAALPKKIAKVEKIVEPDDSMEVDDEDAPSEPKPVLKKKPVKSEKRKLKEMEDDEAGAVEERDNNDDEDEEEVVPPPKKKAKKEDSESESEARDIKKPKVAALPKKTAKVNK